MPTLILVFVLGAQISCVPNGSYIDSLYPFFGREQMSVPEWHIACLYTLDYFLMASVVLENVLPLCSLKTPIDEAM